LCRYGEDVDSNAGMMMMLSLFLAASVGAMVSVCVAYNGSISDFVVGLCKLKQFVSMLYLIAEIF
jgi:hypothetical protein